MQQIWFICSVDFMPQNLFFFFWSRETREATRESKEDWFLELLFFSVIGSSLLLGLCQCRVFFFFFASFPLCPDRVWTGFQLLTLVEHRHSVCVVRVFLQEKKKKKQQWHEHMNYLWCICTAVTHIYQQNYFILRLLLTRKKILCGTKSKCCGVFSSVWMGQALYLFIKKTFPQREQIPSSITPNRNIYLALAD